jgi:hypothetical protein
MYLRQIGQLVPADNTVDDANVSPTRQVKLRPGKLGNALTSRNSLRNNGLLRRHIQGQCLSLVSGHLDGSAVTARAYGGAGRGWWGNMIDEIRTSFDKDEQYAYTIYLS